MAFDKIISTGYQDFEMLITQNYYYVDKTKFIEDFINSGNAATLITRPRRFGKSLTMSLLKNFFSIDYDHLDLPTEKAQNLFHNLYISSKKDLCAKHMGQYPVISISFAGVDGVNFQEAKNRLQDSLMNITTNYYFIIESVEDYFNSLENNSAETKFTPEQIRTLKKFTKDDLEFLKSFESPNYGTDFQSSFLNRLINLVNKYFNKKVILIIDEYDVPLNKALVCGYYNEMLNFMKPIIGVIKNNANVQKSLITGCLRIANESFFTGTNNFRHYDIESIKYSEYIGFTESETQDLLKYYHLEQYYDEVISWYDGYIIGKKRMVCPWDVLSYCQDLLDDPSSKPNTYWINTSSNSLIKIVMQNLNPSIVDYLEKLIAHQSILVEINNHITLNQLVNNNEAKGDIIVVDGKPKYSDEAFWTILYHSGYLTLDSNLNDLYLQQLNDDDKNNYLTQEPSREMANNEDEPEPKYLRIPNKEIHKAFCKHILTRFSRFDRQYIEETNEVFKLLIAEPSNENSSTFSDFLSTLLKRFISIRDGSDRYYKSNPEWYYHAFLNGFISAYSSLGKINLATFNSNKELGNGYADLAFVTNDQPKIGVIIEIKVTQDSQHLKKKAEEALLQIKEKKYITGFIKELGYHDPENIHIYGISFCKKECYVKAEVINLKDYQ